jgi:putative tricarboxylic transport membrane protein
MRVGDAIVGALLLVLAAAIGIYVSGFPAMSGQRFGAALFPALIAAGLAACGALLLVRGLRMKTPAFERADWMRSPPLVLNFAFFCGALVFYIVAAQTLGFLLLALFLRLGVSKGKAASVAIAATAGIHVLFYKLLKVPLPWGLLEFAAAW